MVIAFKLPAGPEATPIPTLPVKNVDIADELATPVENECLHTLMLFLGYYLELRRNHY
jgi:hypothetical protein